MPTEAVYRLLMYLLVVTHLHSGLNKEQRIPKNSFNRCQTNKDELDLKGKRTSNDTACSASSYGRRSNLLCRRAPNDAIYCLSEGFVKSYQVPY